ncbi:TPA: hypothetical protein N2F56_003079 [Salmonella enterica]|nr:hypothetical protein [Salmonella enterica]HAU3223197.1 hypothetical protein [Salmonella enterica subsp. houtenae]HCL4433934.1 hypothetical protein [Salmonella enterica]HCL5082631.1 hypothetical protein [Salmonella enterica]HCL5333355.1 hypothetical protein [Salmonella enterica]
MSSPARFARVIQNGGADDRCGETDDVMLSCCTGVGISIAANKAAGKRDVGT